MKLSHVHFPVAQREVFAMPFRLFLGSHLDKVQPSIFLWMGLFHVSHCALQHLPEPCPTHVDVEIPQLQPCSHVPHPLPGAC